MLLWSFFKLDNRGEEVCARLNGQASHVLSILRGACRNCSTERARPGGGRGPGGGSAVWGQLTALQPTQGVIAAPTAAPGTSRTAILAFMRIFSILTRALSFSENDVSGDGGGVGWGGEPTQAQPSQREQVRSRQTSRLFLHHSCVVHPSLLNSPADHYPSFS